MAHTPGPWINDGGLVCGRETRARFVPGSRFPSDSPFPPGVSQDIFDANEWPDELHDEAMANAALIAAAPDMLAALEAMVLPFALISDEVLRQYPDTPQPIAILAARAAIRSAKGAQPIVTKHIPSRPADRG